MLVDKGRRLRITTQDCVGIAVKLGPVIGLARTILRGQ